MNNVLKVTVDATEVRRVVNEVLAEIKIPVNAVQPADDCPGLWIEFRSVEDREKVLRLLQQIPVNP